VVVVGKRGCGKTCTTMKLAEMLFPSYDYNIHHCYSLVEYMRQVNTIPRWGVLAIEESGTSLDKARWYSPTNRIFSEANQINRYKNFVTFLVLPDVSFLATNHIKMVEYLLWCTKKKKFTFYRNFRVPIDFTNKMIRILKIRNFTEVKLPSKKNYNKYIQRDRAEKDKIRERLMKEASEIENPQKDKWESNPIVWAAPIQRED
jgi:hypothetical protein